MNQVNLSFAKIVATPTTTAWSQAYNAGNLFVVVSFTSEQEEESTGLITLGKQVMNNIEAEFFGLETKNLPTIKEAVNASLTDIPTHISVSLALGYIKDQILYVVIYGAGKIMIKREENIGTLLHRDEFQKDIISASGYIKQNDTVILQTKQFADIIPLSELKDNFDLALPSDIAEALTPHVHNSDEGGAAAVIISITGVPLTESQVQQAIDAEDTFEEEINDVENVHLPIPKDIEEDQETKQHKQPFSVIKHVNKIKLPNLGNLFGGNKKRIVLIAIAAVIIIALAGRIFLTMQEREQKQLQSKFTVVYAEAENKYKEAMGIKTMNPNRSNLIIQETNTYLAKNIIEFPEGSEERVKLEELQRKINGEINEPTKGKTAKAESVDLDDNLVLQTAANKDVKAVTEDDKFVYKLTDDAIISIEKSNNKEKELIKNEDDWKDGISLGVYNGNLYVLDKGNDVVKFIVAQNGYGKASYFPDNKPNLSKTISLTIDGSIWLLDSTGTVSKYTKGSKDSFSIQGVDSITSPVQIITNQDSEYVYVLDKANSRILQIQKTGAYKSSYVNDALKNSTFISLDSNNKEIYFLSDNKGYKLTL